MKKIILTNKKNCMIIYISILHLTILSETYDEKLITSLESLR